MKPGKCSGLGKVKVSFSKRISCGSIFVGESNTNFPTLDSQGFCCFFHFLCSVAPMQCLLPLTQDRLEGWLGGEADDM